MLKKWLEKATIPLFGIKITWGGGNKTQIEKVTVGGIPVVNKEKKDQKEKEENKKGE